MLNWLHKNGRYILLLFAVWIVFEFSISWFAFCDQITNYASIDIASEKHVCVFGGPIGSLFWLIRGWWRSIFYDATDYLVLFNGLLFGSTALLWWVTRRAADAALRHANVMMAVESPMPLITGFKIVQYSQIPGETVIADPLVSRAPSVLEGGGEMGIRPTRGPVKKHGR